MELKCTSKRIKMSAQKNATPHVDCSVSEGFGGETFINKDAEQSFIKNLSSKSTHSEWGFIFNLKDKDLGILE